MNFDLNTLAGFAQIFGQMQSGGNNLSKQRQNKPQNAQKRTSARSDDKLYASSVFASQNGLGEQIDISTILNSEENSRGSSNNTGESISDAQASSNSAKSPLDGLLNLLNKKNDMEKMMPALANIFSAKQQSPANEPTKNYNFKDSAQKGDKTRASNCSKTKENGKSKDIFSPIEFAGYTTLCALNRLYFK